MSLLRFWKKEQKNNTNFLKVDMHSHLLPGIDDGSESMEESIALIKTYADLGFKKLITTPHIMGDFFRNTPEIINGKLQEVKKRLEIEGIKIELEAAAEYYLDEFFLGKLESGEPLMTFGDNYLLFETSYLNEPALLRETIFRIASSGYRPVLAHPERYSYMHDSFDKYKDLFDRGVYFQLNVNSLSGYYSRQAQKIAEKLIQNNMVHFAGTDCHGQRHLDTYIKTMGEKYYRKLEDLNLLNNQLLA